MKARIHKNIWGNWNGYLGSRRVIEFGCDEHWALEWLGATISGRVRYHILTKSYTFNGQKYPATPSGIAALRLAVANKSKP
jgi:hypothetical protein